MTDLDLDNERETDRYLPDIYGSICAVAPPQSPC